MRSQSDHPRSASDRNDSYELCKKAKCYALRSSGTWTPIVNIIAVIPAGSSTASFSVVAHILLWFNTSPPWLGVCREHQQEFKAILNDDKNLQKSLKHSKPSKQNANIKCAYANGSKWQNATALLFASSSLYLGSCGSLKFTEPRHFGTEMVKTSLLSSCCKLQVPLKVVPCTAEFVFATVACILKLILGSHRLEIKMFFSFFRLVFIFHHLIFIFNHLNIVITIYLYFVFVSIHCSSFVHGYLVFCGINEESVTNT